MNDISPGLRPARRSWLPAVIAIPVAGIGVACSLAALASSALNDIPDPRARWLPESLYAQAALAVAAIAIVLASLATTGGRRTIAALGCAAATTSAAILAATLLGGPY
jgi:hypothetical protein